MMSHSTGQCRSPVTFLGMIKFKHPCVWFNPLHYLSCVRGTIDKERPHTRYFASCLYLRILPNKSSRCVAL